MKKIYLIALAFLVTAMAFSQGVTTSSLGGKVTDSAGEPLLGATIVAVHVPSGTVYGAAADFDGFYRISGMRTGGPYKITISYVGFNDDVKEGVYLNLGQATRVSSQLSESATALDEVVVTAVNNGIFGSNRTGTETNISQREINTLPSASRSLADFVRLTPQAQLSEGNDGFSIALAGQNNRYNAIYIDGAVNNDVFGLAGSGTNGGQTGVNPFSVDAIAAFQVNIAPFDVRQSGFSGGSINAITRSGSNEFEGSAYAFVRNESLVGKTPTGLVNDGDTREKVADFSALTYGVRLGGPIVKDKLFFFVNYERQDDETPQPFNISNYTGRSGQAELNGLSDFLQSTYGYNPGIFDNNTRTLVSDKLTAKVDWNINQDNKLSLRHSYVKGDNLEARNSGNRNIGFINGSESFLTKTNSTALELNTRFGNKFANNFILGFTAVRDDRDPFGEPFPTVDIQDGGGTISFGSEPFSTANLLNTDVLNITNNFDIYAGRHTVTLGTTLEFATVKNLFFAFNYGDYTFEDQFDNNGDLISSGLNQFLTGQDADVYQHGYSLVGNGVTGDESAGSADFKTFQAGFYVQDEIQLTDTFKATLGARIDIPYWKDGAVNDDFNNRTIPLLESAGKDLQGAQVGQGIQGNAVFAPRLGFNWDVNGDRSTQIRGGLGIFTSRLPLVWPGGTYNNNGITGGFNFEFGQPFVADVNNQFEDPAPGSGGVGGNIDLIAGDFKLPQVMKYNIAIDQKLPFWGLIATADFLYTDVITDIYYENLNLGGPIGFYQGADNRPFYDRRAEIDDTYGRIILASNTGGGNATNVTFTLTKPLENGFSGQVSYAYGESNKVFDGTSSQNSSQWRNIQTVNGKNSRIPVSRSDFALGNRITANVNYELDWSENVKTTIGLFYSGFQAGPYSFTYREGRDLLNDDSRDNALMYIPANAAEIQFNGDAAEQAAQWERLDTFINSIEYLRENRGNYAARNAVRGPWSHIVDLKFLQDFSVNVGGKKNTLQFSADIFNFTNLLNKDWGELKFTSGNVSPLQTVSTNDIPVFTINDGDVNADGTPNIEQIDDFGLQSSRWQAQLGIRYIFN
ncbi:MAG: TonB-dependent receptor [Croceitalea sp.]|nr:carboxypeptidase regulatory-like domain-containing protein [Croceitalea sp.]MBT8238838.1 carboxypeptidase regulatory-like domain-containing protein [Croceitalea sp.]NNC35712.1 TonB-dependent receptor [Croceitalea sp.]NNL09481.1 TonB-dependent receptor [Croceitalea sp.]NNM17792.1 TonB-dependent receptor [Croceitalea sp.]